MSTRVPRLIRPAEMRALLKVSRSTLYRWIKAGYFPPPKRFLNQGQGWSEDVYIEWLNR